MKAHRHEEPSNYSKNGFGHQTIHDRQSFGGTPEACRCWKVGLDL
jgi:hypothetical protein